MNVITILRKQLDAGYLSTYRFGETADGRFVAVSNTGKFRAFPNRFALEQAIEGFVRIGYTARAKAPGVVRKGDVVVQETPAVTQEVVEAPIF